MFSDDRIRTAFVASAATKRPIGKSRVRGPKRKAPLFEPELDFSGGGGADSRLGVEFVERISYRDLCEASICSMSA
jgi:hypothetical protein